MGDWRTSGVGDWRTSGVNDCRTSGLLVAVWVTGGRVV